MTTLRRTLLGLLLLAAAGIALAEPASADLINTAGRQRMLSQRIVKAYAQIGVGIDVVRSRQLRDDSLRQFDEQLALLRAKLSTAAYGDELAAIEEQWRKVRELARGSADWKRAQQLNVAANELHSLSHRLANRLAEETGGTAGRLVNLAGRQRMLSQRMAKAYFLAAWGKDTPAFAREFDLARNEFAAAIELMRQAPENTPEIAAELEQTALQWEWFKQALALDGAFSYRLLAAETSEALLTRLERLVGLYTRVESK